MNLSDKNYRVLMLSGYDAVSHRLWRERLRLAFPNWEWTTLIGAPRHFAFRLRSNPMQWVNLEAATLNQDYDLLIATSMVDLSTLRGMAPKLTSIPTLLYFHENQFAYPDSRQRSDNIEQILIPIYSAACSDLILFNSEYNRSTFLQGVNELSRKLPEPFPQNVLDKLNLSEIAPVPLPDWPARAELSSRSNQLEVVWNHRWEYDKGPALLLEIVNLCWHLKLPVKFNIVGQQFREQPGEFASIHKTLQRLHTHFDWQPGHFGYIANEEEYRHLLDISDVVLSTALHDFQGLAIQEACLAGCSPLAPRALAYPEYLPDGNTFPRLESDASTAKEVVSKLKDFLKRKQAGHALPLVDLKTYQLKVVKERYQQLIHGLLNTKDEER